MAEYSLRDYGAMIADDRRFSAYRRAIAEAVRPGDLVLELGCGPSVFAMLACQAGAKKVYAIESADVVDVARQLAAANGLADRIEFIQNDSRKVELPERVSVIVTDLRGALPLYDHAIPAVEDARRRFLAPGGILIPKRDILKAAVVAADEFYCGLVAPWHSPVCGMDLSSSLPLILNSRYSGLFKHQQLLTETLTWGELDYPAGAATDVIGDMTFQVVRSGTAHGVCVWFETQLLNKIGYSTAPGAANSVHAQVFFPWLERVRMEQGQRIHVRLQADLVGSDYVWQWETQIPANRFGPERHFNQSTFHGEHLSPASLRRRAADFVPKLSESGEADRWLLQRMDGKTALQQMAQEAAQRFPKTFPRWTDALRRAAELAAEFSR